MKIIYAITIGVMFLLAAEDVRTKEMDWWKLGMLDWVYLYAAEESLEYGRWWNDWIVHDRDFFS